MIGYLQYRSEANREQFVGVDGLNTHQPYAIARLGLSTVGCESSHFHASVKVHFDDAKRCTPAGILMSIHDGGYGDDPSAVERDRGY